MKNKARLCRAPGQEDAMRDAALPIILIVLGIAWLLNSLQWLPDVQWLWILGLSGSGAAILAIDGVTKSSIVAGPLLILAGILSFFHQYHSLGWRFIIPVFLIASGVTMLAARSPSVPESRRLKRHIPHSAADKEHHG
jgi:hypothetical protein